MKYRILLRRVPVLRHPVKTLPLGISYRLMEITDAENPSSLNWCYPVTFLHLGWSILGKIEVVIRFHQAEEPCLGFFSTGHCSYSQWFCIETHRIKTSFSYIYNRKNKPFSRPQKSLNT